MKLSLEICWKRRRRTISKLSSALARTPGRIDATDYVAQPRQCLATAHASDLDIVGLGAVAGSGGRGQANDEEAVGRQFGRLGEGLGKGELGLERAGGQVAFVVQLAGVGDILVDQDQGRAVVCQQLTEGVAGVGGVLVVGAHAFVGSARFAVAAGGMAQLPGKLAPQGAHLRAVRLGDWVAGRDAVADEDDAVDAREFGHFGGLHDVVDAVQLARAARRKRGGRGRAWSASCRRRSWSAAARRARRPGRSGAGVHLPTDLCRLWVR